MKPFITNQVLIANLKRIRLFDGLDEQFYDLFIPYLNLGEFSKKTTIIIEGASGESVYFLLKGNIRIVKKTLSDEEYTVAVFKDEDGIFFGEMGLLTEDKRSASVLTQTDCVLAELTRVRFDEFINNYPAYGIKILKGIATSICQKLQKSNNDTLTLYQALIHEIGESYL